MNRGLISTTVVITSSQTPLGSKYNCDSWETLHQTRVYFRWNTTEILCIYSISEHIQGTYLVSDVKDDIVWRLPVTDEHSRNEISQFLVLWTLGIPYHDILCHYGVRHSYRENSHWRQNSIMILRGDYCNKHMIYIQHYSLISPIWNYYSLGLFPVIQIYFNLWISLTLNVRGPSYLGLTRSISWLLMPWRLTPPGHQQPWYWRRIGRFLSYLRKDFSYLRRINVEERHKM